MYFAFAGDLLIEPVESDFSKLPSPEQLKRKVILKVRSRENERCFTCHYFLPPQLFI